MAESTIGRTYGWRGLGVLDPRHLQLKIPTRLTKAVPSKYTLFDKHMPKVYDQGQAGSCVANGVAGQIERLLSIEGIPVFTPSRLAMYWFGRVLEGTTKSDSGLVITDEMKALTKFGYCDEKLWPYNLKNLYKDPPQTVVADCATRTAEKYQAVADNENGVFGAMLAGYMPCFGFTVFTSFESDAAANTGVMPMPKKGESVLGGHCVDAVGWDIGADKLFCRNSWGSAWGADLGSGERGYFTMPLSKFAMSPQYASGFEVLSFASK